MTPQVNRLSPEMAHLRELQTVVQITMPRAGSEYLQSLFDGHPEVLVFNTNFRFFTDYVSSSKVFAQEGYDLEEIIYEFIGKEMHRLKTKYFQAEGMHKLGNDGAEAVNISLQNYTKCHWCPVRITSTVRAYGLTQEFITPYTPEQNGLMERFFRSLKEECIWRHRFESLAHARHVIGQWIRFYNNERPHQSLGYAAPSAHPALAS